MTLPGVASPSPWILVFDSIHDVLAAEQAFKQAGLWHDVVPLPRDLRSDCGMAILVRQEDAAAVSRILEGDRFRSHRLYRPTGAGHEEVTAVEVVRPQMEGRPAGAGVAQRPVSELIYLDHAATSWPKPAAVWEELARYAAGIGANAGRSGHRPALEAARLVFEVRQGLARVLGVSRPESVSFVRGATEGLNLVLKGFLKAGDRVAVSPMEHNSVMRPLGRLARERGIAIETLPADAFGRVDVDAARRLARQRPWALLVVQHASNVNGAMQDLAGLRAAFADTPMLVDGAQTAGLLPLDLEEQGIDFFACSAHKGLLGPTGLGACYLSPRCDVAPLQEGGTGSQSESFEQPAFRPDRYEAGTLNLLGIAALRGALRAIEQQGLPGGHVRKLAGMLGEGLAEVPGVRIYSPRDGSALCVAFGVEGISPEEVASRLEAEHVILCRAGLHCAPAAHRHLGTLPAGTVRLSPGCGNTAEQIQMVVKAAAALRAGRR